MCPVRSVTYVSGRSKVRPLKISCVIMQFLPMPVFALRKPGTTSELLVTRPESGPLPNS